MNFLIPSKRIFKSIFIEIWILAIIYKKKWYINAPKPASDASKKKKSEPREAHTQ